MPVAKGIIDIATLITNQWLGREPPRSISLRCKEACPRLTSVLSLRVLPPDNGFRREDGAPAKLQIRTATFLLQNERKATPT